MKIRKPFFPWLPSAPRLKKESVQTKNQAPNQIEHQTQHRTKRKTQNPTIPIRNY